MAQTYYNCIPDKITSSDHLRKMQGWLLLPVISCAEIFVKSINWILLD